MTFIQDTPNNQAAQHAGRAHDTVNLLVSLDEAYLPHLETMLVSLAATNRAEHFSLHLLHRSIPQPRIESLSAGAEELGIEIIAHTVDASLFKEAPVSKRYPQEMYYRLLASYLLPSKIERILYLDPDILVINPIRPLWEMDMGEKPFAAAAHVSYPLSEVVESVNRARLDVEEEKYFNSGVLLIDVLKARQTVEATAVFDYVRKHGQELILPDQDVLNALYGDQIVEIDERVWNYDARAFRNYYHSSRGSADMNWVMENTAILHFCGRAKPWKHGYPFRFGALYKHYESQARNFFSTYQK